MNDWKARAEREAAALLDETGYAHGAPVSRDILIALLAAAWMQGVNLGAHDTLTKAEAAFERLQESLR